MSTISNVLVANRGEIALRIIRGVHDYGASAVAVYADQDRDASFVSAADQAYSLDGTTPAQTYLDADKLLHIAQRSGADAIHPGYGFLAENPDFAAAVVDAGLTWIGPAAQSILALGDKVQARQVAERVGVNPVPGTNEPLASRREVEGFVAKWGYPMVLKRADGGGGRGISVIANDTDLDQFFSGRDEETLGAFFVERFVQRARHIETQCGRDSFGTFAVYSTRDCSLQRRHQKLIEEAPAPFVTPEVEAQLHDASQRLFEGVDYVGLGTCEFLLDQDNNLYFLEVNPRLQVEHTVTEEVSGLDLVGQQLQIAAGLPLTPPPQTRGHSIELRITSEDPANGLAPSLGTLNRIDWPTGPGVRIDTGVVVGDSVTPDFDSMIAKIIVTGQDRTQALSRARRALKDLQIEGVATPIPLYQEILDRPEFAGNDLLIWTRWMEDVFLPQFTPAETEKTDLTAGAAATETAAPLQRFTIEIDGRRHELALPFGAFGAGVVGAATDAPRQPQPLRSQREGIRTMQTVKQHPDVVASPLQAIVVRVCVTSGDRVEEGDLVLVMESMKMEKYVHAHRSGEIDEVLVTTGDNVSPNQALVRLVTSGEEN